MRGRKLVWKISLGPEKSLHSECQVEPSPKLSQDGRLGTEEMRLRGSCFWGTKMTGQRRGVKMIVGGTQAASWVQSFGNGMEITRTATPCNVCVRRKPVSPFYRWGNWNSEHLNDLPLDLANSGWFTWTKGDWDSWQCKAQRRCLTVPPIST